MGEHAKRAGAGAAEPPRIAVVGLGAMGSRIARRLVTRGHDVVVWNRTEAKVQPLVAAGAGAAASPADAARRAEVVLVMVSDPAALDAVVDGPDGLARGLGAAGAAGAVVQLSTVTVESVHALRARLPEHTLLLDAPVLGSLAEADGGTLTILCGGTDAAVERCAPVLSELGSVVGLGALGFGTAAKLLANNALFGALGVLGESIAIGRRLGLPLEAIFTALSHTPLAAQAQRRRPALEAGAYPPRFALELARKDADLIAAAAAATGPPLKVSSAMRAWFTEAEAAGHAADDYTAVLAHILAARA
ncbi:NAD(P)-dependent oxidoreductase [Jiangella alba]|nr:NAD(P)-dependent oxidoreductase [Jiangella alba]